MTRVTGPLYPYRVMAYPGKDGDNRSMKKSACSAEHSEPYALRVIGDSMSPEFDDGHIIIVDPGMALMHLAYVVVEYRGEYLFGRYHREADGQFIRYLHPAWPAVRLDGPFELKGLVVQRNSGRRGSTRHYDYQGLAAARS